MEPEIEYGRDVIVAVRRGGEWAWYVSEKDLWFLDLTALAADFVANGQDVPADHAADRFGIAVVDESTAPRFLDAMRPFRTTTEALASRLTPHANATRWDDVAHLWPALLVDFDNQRLVSMYPEPASFERYVPPGWTGERGDFLDAVPAAEQYWKLGERDLFRELTAR